MAEAHTNSRSKAKLQTPPFPGSVFTGIETPAAFRDMAEKSLSSAKDQYEKMKSAAEEATGVLEETYASATKGASNYGLKVLEVARTNTNAAFDFASELFGARSLSEVVELSTAHARKQFETAAAQTKELAALAQKVATEASEPIKGGITKAARKVG
jgi:phasin